MTDVPSPLVLFVASDATGGEANSVAEGSEARQMARLRWRCRRGMLELDLLLTRFIEQHYDTLDAAERTAFDRLLQTPDPTLFAFLQGTEDPEPELRQLVTKIRQ